MEAIKCPLCGSKATERISEDRYYCNACEVEFMVYDRSEEFRETDEHIDSVHQDLKNAIDNISLSQGTAEVDALFDNAFHLVELGEFDTAKNKFDELCKTNSNDYRSWWGEILVLTKNMQAVNEGGICSDEMTMYVSNMRATKNFTQDEEDRVNNSLNGFIAASKGEVENMLTDLGGQINAQGSNLQQMNAENQQMSDRCLQLEDMVKQEKKKSETAREIKIKSINTIFIIALIVIELIVIIKTGLSVAKSVGIIGAPLPDANASGAGSAFGKAALNFILIPIKVIVGGAIVVGVYFVWSFVKEMLTSFPDDQNETFAHSFELDDMVKRLSFGQSQYNELYSGVQSIATVYNQLKARLDAFNAIDVTKPETFGPIRNIVDNFPNGFYATGESASQSPKMQFCQYCGAQIQGNEAFCGECGASLAQNISM
jgi:hypothetical protein